MATDLLLELFKAELSADTTAVRAFPRTTLIATVIGPEDTREKLLPLLLDCLYAYDDEVLLSLAEQLVVLCDFIGPLSEYSHILIPPLEYLAAQDETVVREKAVTSFSIILSKAAQVDAAEKLSENYVVPAVERLATGDWFCSRVSACGLVPIVYPYASEENRGTLREILATLMSDETPTVRRSAGAKMKDLAIVAEKSVIESMIYPLLTTVWGNEETDTVRVSGLSALITIAPKFTSSENQTKILPIILSAATDKSWRIRLSLAESFDQLIEPFQSEVGQLLPSFKLLLEDTEKDIRIAALNTLARFVSKLKQKDINESDFASSFQLLSGDAIPSVRAAAAKVIGPLAVAYGHPVAEASLLPIMLQMMRDEFRDVRLNIVCHTAELCQLISLPTVENLLVSTVESLMTDSQWRVRLEIVDQIPQLAQKFGSIAFQSNLEPLFLNAFSDVVYAVRESAVQNVQKLGEAFGPQWAAKDLLPRLLEKYHGTQATIVASPTSGRIPGFGTSVDVAENERDVLVKVLPPASIENDIVHLLMSAIKDPVSNVRFGAASVINTLASEQSIPSTLTQKFLKPALTRLMEEDLDVDVQYFTEKALQAIEATAS